VKTTRENIQNRIEEINKELEKITKLDKKFRKENCNASKMKTATNGK